MTDRATTLETLSKRYVCLYVLDLVSMSFELIKSNDVIVSTLRDIKGLQNQMLTGVRMLSHKESLEQIEEFCNLSTLPARLSGKDSVTIIFHGKLHGWCRATFTKFGDSDPATKVVFSIEAVDEEYNRQDALLRGLSQEYATLWYVNGASGHASLVKSNRAESATTESTISRVSGDFDELIGWFVENIIVEEDRADTRAVLNLDYLKKHTTDGSVAEHSFVMPFADGQLHNAQVRVARVGADNENARFIVGFRDIDAIVADEAERRRELEDANAIIEGLSSEFHTVWAVDKKTLEMHLVRDVSEETVTKEAVSAVSVHQYWDEPADMYVRTYIVPDDRKRVRHGISSTTILRELEKSNKYEISFRKGNDQETTGFEQAVFANVGTDRFVCGFRDIGDIVAAERERRRELEDARRAAESANIAKTSFISNMSHDIRTPMNAVLGLSKLAQKHLDNPAEAAEYLEQIEVAGVQLLNIINKVLEISHIESGKVTIKEEVVDTIELFASLKTIFGNQARTSQLTFKFTRDFEHRWFYIDRTHMEEVLVNLVSNAMKYTPDGGTIDVSFTELPSETDGYAVIRTIVRDTGIGMSDEYQQRMFDAFEREQSSTVSGIQGTGLGLSIVKKLIDQMGGTIKVESEQGVGTTMTVDIPHRIATEPVQREVECVAIDYNSMRGKRVLLTEDIDVNAMIATEILKSRGVAVERAENGLQCVEMLKAAPAGHYDVVFMDIQMPVMDGYQAAREIRALDDKEKASIPIIAMTANAFLEDKIRVLDAGMNLHVRKPIDVDELFGALSSVLAYGSLYVKSAELDAFKQQALESGHACGYFIYRADGSGDILHTDNATAEIFGCNSTDEFIAYVGGTFRGMVHPDDYDRVNAFIQQKHDDTEVNDYTYRIFRKDGSVRTVHDIGFKTLFESSLLYYVYIEDITDVEKN